MHLAPAHPSGRSFRRLAFALVAIAVLLIGWLQFVWLSQLRSEEVARRAVALRVVSSNFQDRIAREFEGWLDDMAERPPASLPADLLAGRVYWTPGRSRGEVHDATGTSLVGRARLQQLLGNPLIQAAEKGAVNRPGVWLEPAALVECRGRCRAWLLDQDALAAGPLREAAEVLFADFGEQLRLEIVSVGPQGNNVRRLYPLQAAASTMSQYDLATGLLGEVPVLGPGGYRWELRVGHAGSTLEQAVAGAHLRNLMLSALMLGLLLVGVIVIDRYSRNRAALAEQRILFVASASHELRTPLSVIGAAADNLSDGTVPEAKRVREYGALIRAEVGKLTAMVDNVLEFSQTTGKPREFVPVSLDLLLHEALDLCRPVLGEREVILDIMEKPPKVLGQPAGLHSVLVNLFSNAGKHAQGDGPIRIALGIVRSGRRHALALSVSNHLGGGRQEADPERWFEPFQRGQAATERSVPGTGIGLAVARTIAQQHGGGLAVRYGGAETIRFTLYLPLGD